MGCSVGILWPILFSLVANTEDGHCHGIALIINSHNYKNGTLISFIQLFYVISAACPLSAVGRLSGLAFGSLQL